LGVFVTFWWIISKVYFYKSYGRLRPPKSKRWGNDEHTPSRTKKYPQSY
jgi:hypothetical protein